ncbi:MAG TPA: hypothetical protein VMS77_01625 [Conexivisphaerales archaeon]|nr:hypothetical protein [Conexivisphaerales archaeon]
MKKVGRLVIIGVLTALLIVVVFIPIVPVDNAYFYGHVSLTCRYLGFGGTDIFSRYYNLKIGFFQFSCGGYFR